MRLGVLDVGSNTVHLLVVDAHRGAQPDPQHSRKSVLRLAEHIGNAATSTSRAPTPWSKRLSGPSEKRRNWTATTCSPSPPRRCATRRTRPRCSSGCATEAGVDLQVLSGEDEARLTFLAVRRWFGWSAGRLLCLDIGGGSLELAGRHRRGAGRRAVACRSAPAGSPGSGLDRPTRRPRRRSPRCGRTPTTQLAGRRPRLLEAGRRTASVATEQDVPHAGPAGRRRAVERRVRGRGAALSRHRAAAGHRLHPAHAVGRARPSSTGSAPGRAHQLLAGAVVAEAAMDALGVDELDICPWALREGVILRRLDLDQLEAPLTTGDAS